MECSICFTKKIFFFKCFQCVNCICFSCFKKVISCPFCRVKYTPAILLLKYKNNISKYYKNINKKKTLTKRERKKNRLKKIFYNLY